jgi:hypothetical protein
MVGAVKPCKCEWQAEDKKIKYREAVVSDDYWKAATTANSRSYSSYPDFW